MADSRMFLSKRWRCSYELFKLKGYNVNILSPKNLNWKAFREVIKKYSVRYWYHMGHGLYSIYGVKRTALKFPDRIVVSHKRSDYVMVPPPSYENLPERYESEAGSMFELGLQNRSKLKFVFIDSCYSAYSDIDGDWADYMAEALGMYSENNQSWGDQIYIGWTEAARYSLNPELQNSSIVEDRFVYWFFDSLRQYSVSSAYQRAINSLNTSQEKEDMRNLYRNVGLGVPELITIPDN